MKLEFKNYRRPFQRDPLAVSIDAKDRPQIEDICQKESWAELLAEMETKPTADLAEEFFLIGVELVDVVDESGVPVYQIYFFDFGTAYIYEAGTTNEVGGASQHYLEMNDGDEKVVAAIADAYKNADPAIEQVIDF